MINILHPFTTQFGASLSLSRGPFRNTCIVGKHENVGFVVIHPSLNHGHNPLDAYGNFIANAIVQEPGAYNKVTECLHLL